MCQMRIILKHADREELMLEDAAFVSVTGDGIMANALLEEPMRIRDVVIESIDFLESRLILKKVEREGAE